MKLRSNKRNLTHVSWDMYEIASTWRQNRPRHTTTEKYDSKGKSKYFRFDYDNKMS